MLVWLDFEAMGSKALTSSGHGATVSFCNLSMGKDWFSKQVQCWRTYFKCHTSINTSTLVAIVKQPPTNLEQT